MIIKHINMCLRNRILLCVAKMTNDRNVKTVTKLLNSIVLLIQNLCCVLYLHFSSKMGSRVTSLI